MSKIKTITPSQLRAIFEKAQVEAVKESLAFTMKSSDMIEAQVGIEIALKHLKGARSDYHRDCWLEGADYVWAALNKCAGDNPHPSVVNFLNRVTQQLNSPTKT